MRALTQLLAELPAAPVLGLVAVLVMAETATLLGVVVPTLSTLLLVGFLCRLGSLNLWVALVVAVLAGVAGDHIGYWTGRRQGPRVRDSRFGRRIGRRRWEQADRFVRRLGGRAVFVGRFLTVVRTLVPQLAGVSGVRYAAFAWWNLAGVACWASAEILAGYAAGRSYEKIAGRFGDATVAVLALTAATVAGLLGAYWLVRQPDPVRAVYRRFVANRGSEPRPSPWQRRLTSHATSALGVRAAAGITLAVGLALVVVVGSLVVVLTQTAARYSGITAWDPPTAAWMARQPDWHRIGFATSTACTIAVMAFTVIALLITAVITLARLRRRPTLLDALGAVGPLVPLAVLSYLVTWTPNPGVPVEPATPTQDAVVVAGLAVFAWSLARVGGRLRAALIWAGTITAVLVPVAARLYVGWTSASAAVVSIMVGSMWAGAVVIIIRSREQFTAVTSPAMPDTARELAHTGDHLPPSDSRRR